MTSSFTLVQDSEVQRASNEQDPVVNIPQKEMTYVEGKDSSPDTIIDMRKEETQDNTIKDVKNRLQIRGERFGSPPARNEKISKT